ncbi:MAG: ATP-dependent DNA helicase [Gammaproteobacteria bacterium]|nr:MAG: ATP-dependent DNA helicase [Gammaproteobacteria bacterium]
MSLEVLHPVVRCWFEARFGAPTPVQTAAWPVIAAGEHALLIAPTGGGKTLASFLAAIDALVRRHEAGTLEDGTAILYVSPLRALSNDIHRNLEEPLAGIAAAWAEQDFTLRPPGAAARLDIRVGLRTGDTSAEERRRMPRRPPHILVSTPESLAILLTSPSGRRMLGTVRWVIVDELHALLETKRGAHLALSLERLEALIEAAGGPPPQRIGATATVAPVEEAAAFLCGAGRRARIVAPGGPRDSEVDIEVPGMGLSAPLPAEAWNEIYDRIAALSAEARSTLVFVNNRRQAERVARALAERLGAEHVAAHHGSLAREHRLETEERFKRGALRLVVATASLELGVDIGAVDLVCQIGSPRRIGTWLQRLGRAGHGVGRRARGRLFPTAPDELIECLALLDAVHRGVLDPLMIPPGPLDVLAQHIVAEVAGAGDWDEAALWRCLRRARPYAALSRTRFEAVVTMLTEGYAPQRGRRRAHLSRDEVNGRLRARRGARLAAITNAGAIPDSFDYEVRLDPEDRPIGTLNEDFAVESLPGDIVQLGNQPYRILRIERGVVRVAEARGQTPNIPFWFGEAPARGTALSRAVAALQARVEAALERGEDPRAALVPGLAVNPAALELAAAHLRRAHAALGALPTERRLICERFFDRAGDQHLVLHSPLGSRVNRALGLLLRKRFCQRFNFELQAAALEDSVLLSLGATHGFALEDLAGHLRVADPRHVLTQAVLQTPLFTTRWRWVACIALAVLRRRGAKRVAPQWQRSAAEDLVAQIFPDQLACQDNLRGERRIPDHPLVEQTLYDCLHEAMDLDGLEALLDDLAAGRVQLVLRDRPAPSPLAEPVLSARPWAFLDDAPAEERRSQLVARDAGGTVAEPDPAAVERVRREAWPAVDGVEDMHDALLIAGFIGEDELGAHGQDAARWRSALEALSRAGRATALRHGGRRLWTAAERLGWCLAVWPEARREHAVEATGRRAAVDPDQALVELLRCRFEVSGPVDEAALGRAFGLPRARLAGALARLVAEGQVLPFDYDGRRHWCERALLARLNRYSIAERRRAAPTVSLADFGHFLFAWHGLLEPPAGEAALFDALDLLEGWSAPAGVWESGLLAARVADLGPDMLDRACSSGRVFWLRLHPPPRLRQGALQRQTPIALLPRGDAAHWFGLCGPAPQVSATAERVARHLERHGASFYMDLVQHCGLLRSQIESALGELAAAGRVSADRFAGLRALIAPATRKPARVRLLRRGMLANSLENAGRWWLIDRSAPAPAENSRFRLPYESLEHLARAYLRRYGVVFRAVLDRESATPPWRDLLYVYRRLEARGELSGGRFVAGVNGEQFALPEAIGLLQRSAAERADDGRLVTLSSADPLNLVGTVLPGARVAAAVDTRLVFRAGMPVACAKGSQLRFFGEPGPELAWAARQRLRGALPSPSPHRH